MICGQKGLDNMRRHIVLFIITVVLVSSALSGCKKKDKNTTVTVNENTVVDADD